jgi:Leucine-rich repeat (LRR) protein
LVLSASPDLLCRNIMCEKVGGPCICRMALSLSRMAALRSLELADNNLVALPDTVWGYPAAPDTAGAQVLALERLVLRNNRFQHLPPSAGLGRAADSLQELDLRWNNLASAAAFESWLPRMRGLRKLLIGGNPICQLADDIQRVRDMLAAATSHGSGEVAAEERHAQTPAVLDLSADAALSRSEPTICRQQYGFTTY